MTSIFKYELQIKKEQTIEVPMLRKILDIQMQNGNPVMWVQVETSPKMPLVIKMFGTGFDMPEKFKGIYLGTVQDGSLVWHFFTNLV